MHHLAAIVAVLAMVLPLIGPTLDSDFAARQPNHSHIYNGDFDLDHAHPYQSGASDGSTDASRIIFVSSYDGATQGAADLVVPLLDASRLYPDSSSDGASSLAVFNIERPRELFLAPPVTPPRA